MSSRGALSLVGGVAVMAFWLKPVKPVRVNGSGSSAYWTIRSWLWNYPLASNGGLEQWNVGNLADDESLCREVARTNRIWLFLRPFFASRGYDLYVMEDEKNCWSDTLPSPSAPRPPARSSFPFAKLYAKDDRDFKFCHNSPRVWAARDQNGHDVVLKAISGPMPSNDLQVLRLLTSEPLARDPRNHTIPVLDYLEIFGIVFVVMPRWTCVTAADFLTVGEIIRYGHSFLEALAFLHEHSIAHRDVLLQNMVMDVFLPENAPKYAGLRGPERRYAFIDFEAALLSLPGAVSTPYTQTTTSEDMVRAFKKDIRWIASQLQVNLRCLQDILPALGSLLDDMWQNPGQLTATSILARYEKICQSLTADDLQREPQAIRYERGRLLHREFPPVYIQV